MFNEALKLARKGFYVFPCHYIKKDGTCSCGRKSGDRCSPGKHPKLSGGCNSGTKDEEQIQKWWTQTPDSNIGIATGKEYNGRLFIVLDVDTKPGKVGAASLEALVTNFGPLPVTLTATTGSGGKHYYFHVPYAVVGGQGKENRLGIDLDIQSIGLLVIAPPSNAIGGKKYSWDDAGAGMAECPAWLLEKLERKQSPVEEKALTSTVEVLTSDLQSLKIEDKKLNKKEVELMLTFISADCAREDWFKIAASIKYILNDRVGFQVFNTWSKTAKEKYSEKDVIKQWKTIDTEKGIEAGTLCYYAKLGGYLGAAVTNEDTADAVSEIIEKFIYARPNESFYDLSTMERLNENQFNKTYGFAFKKGTATDTITRNKNFRIIKGITYAPGKEIFTSEKSLDSDAIIEKFNLWRPCATERRKGDVSPFLAQINYILNPNEAEILLDYLAFQVQFPGVKIHWAITIVGKPGIGKSYLELVMQQVLGAHNVHTLDVEHLHEQFTEWQSKTQFVIVHEMMARGRMELMGKLKSMITDPVCSIREMYAPVYKQPNRFNFLFFTNNKNSLLIEKDDRRHCILNSEAEPHADEDKYYKPLFE